MHLHRFLISALLIIVVLSFVSGQTLSDRQIAARFAPIFHQALGSDPRSDYITNFKFDGDWRGDNNWAKAENKSFPLRAYIYYSVSETRSHYFIHYAVFHPRDYKGGGQKGTVISGLLRRGAQLVGGRDPTGLLDEATMAHENDLEGALVVAAKNGEALSGARIVFAETLKHNTFISYVAGESPLAGFGTIKTEGNSVRLYIEPMGHGIEAYTGSDAQTSGKQLVEYKFTGTAADPEMVKNGPVGYELLPIETTLWPRAKPSNRFYRQMYGEVHNYGTITVEFVRSNGRAAKKQVRVGRLGSAFLGSVGGKNMARPPWGWFDRNRRGDPLGAWYFDPARIVKRNFSLDDSFSAAYTRLPFWAR